MNSRESIYTSPLLSTISSPAGSLAASRFRLGLIAIAAVLGLLLPSAAQALPADRAYEMVSPTDKNGQGVGGGGFVGSYLARADGEQVGYTSMGGWGGTPAYGVSAFYLGSRGATSWSSAPLLLPNLPAGALFSTGVKAISRDFSRRVVNSNMNQDTGAEVANPDTWHYLVDSETGQRELFLGEDLNGRDYFASTGDFKGSDDFSVVYVVISARLTPTAQAIPGSLSQRLVYRYAGEGTLEVISEDPSGTLGEGRLSESGRPVSADGSVVYYNGPQLGAFGSGRPLYRRDFSAGDDPPTVLVNASENTIETVPEGGATFVGASRDGQVAYFISGQKLVDGDTDTFDDLYRWEADRPAGSRLTLITVDDEAADGVDGSAIADEAKVAPDGSRIYFGHSSQLVAGEPTDPGNKLYAWDADDGLRYITDAGALGSFGGTGLRMSDNAEYLGLLSEDDLVGENATGLAQAYLYDYGAEALSCVSCASGGASNSAAALWSQKANTVAFMPNDFPRRNLSNRGDVFFETTDGLLPADTNDRADVYLWKDGSLDLISTGRSADNSHFADASADGDDVFFLTRSQLSGWDTDNQLDLYDARVGGGLPEPPVPEAPCLGADCQAAGPNAPGHAPSGQTSPGTDNYVGEGNPKREADRRCKRADRKSKRLHRKAKRLKRKVKQLKRKADADGRRAARRRKRARRAKLRKRARKAKHRSKRAEKRAERCNRRARR